MSIFKDILNKLLHRGDQQAQATTGVATGTPAGDTGAPLSGTTSGGQPALGSKAAEAQPTTGGATGASGPPLPTALAQVDVEGVMDSAVKEAGETLNWRTSIVDTLKALGIDSSLEHRKALAKELNYSGDMDDSAAMNTWLHKRVMQELAQNGGKLPKTLTE